jgi:hypothetical protein
MNVTYWSTDYRGGAGKWCCLVGKARNYLVPYLKEKQEALLSY